MTVSLVNSKAKRLVRRNESSLKQDMILQFVQQRFKKTHAGPASSTDKYLGRQMAVIEMVTGLVDAGEQATPRSVWYKLRDGDFSQVQIDTVLKDLTLSINVHPYQLGVVPEVAPSLVCVPSGSELRVREVHNIFKYMRDNQDTHNPTYIGGSCQVIAAMYKLIEVCQPQTRIRAVVVCEHKSIKDKIERYVDQPGFEGILLVLTSGFSDAACREFLHLLAINEALLGVPFLWLSDCDAHSLQIYSVIKYGSAHTAYASPSMVCPQLVFGGLTMEKFETFVRGHPARFVASKLRHRQLSAAEQETIRQEKAGEAKTQDIPVTRPSSPIN